jgi:hypothetical protein
LIWCIFRVAPPVLGYLMSASTLFGLAIAALSFPVGCLVGAQPASITAIGLSPPAATADAKACLTPTAENRNKLQKKSDLEISRKEQ